MFFIFGIGVAIFLELLLLLKKKKSVADHVLGAWLLLNIVHLFVFYGYYTETLLEYPHLLGIDFGMPIAHGVCLFFYGTAITTGKINKKAILIHLIPTVIIYLCAIHFFALPGPEKIKVYLSKGVGYEWFTMLNEITMIVSGFAYSIWTFLLTRRYSKVIRDKFSNIDKKELNWLKYLSIAFAVIWITVLFSESSIMIFTVVVLFIFFIGFFGINQMSIFSSQNETSEIKIVHFETPISEYNLNVIPETLDLKKEPVKRYAKSGLSSEKADVIYEKLGVVMHAQRLFLDNELTLSQLAGVLEIPSNHLSQVINEKEGKNFYAYINTLRVNEFIRISKLPENTNITLIALAYESGFNSKSTFNKHFKAVVGKTPLEFINNISSL